MAILTVGLLASLLPGHQPILQISLWVIAALTAVTAARRIRHIYTKLP